MLRIALSIDAILGSFCDGSGRPQLVVVPCPFFLLRGEPVALGGGDNVSDMLMETKLVNENSVAEEAA